MERLTFEGNFCDIAQCRELPCKYDGNCTQKEVWERLKQFEDAVQTPEAAWAKKTIEMAFSDDTSEVERLRELYKADKEGRVMLSQARQKIQELIAYAPSIDAEPVVRCQDCKNFRRNEENDPYCADRRGLSDPEPDGYCSYGEQREE